MKFTIITATLNAAATIRDCVHSVMEQQAPGLELEHLILDGGSTDGTLAAIRACNSPFVHITAEPDSGVYHAFNRGLALASGEVVAFLNADDQYLPGALNAVAKAFDENTQPSCIHGNIEVNGRVIRPRRGLFSLGGARIYHPAAFMRRELLTTAGGFDTRFRIAADLDLFLRARQLAPFLHLDRPLARFALGGLSTRRFSPAQRELYAIMRKNDYSLPYAAFVTGAELLRSGGPFLIRSLTGTQGRV